MAFAIDKYKKNVIFVALGKTYIRNYGCINVRSHKDSRNK